MQAQLLTVALAAPRVHLAAPQENAKEMLALAVQNADASVILFPELAVTGCSCGDLFGQRALVQKTEETLGGYDLHDFALYHMLRGGRTPQRILEMACLAYPEISRDAVRATLRTLYRRFFSQQFKRSCMPDGPKVGSVGLSPRGGWQMPSDAEAAEFLRF